VQPQSGTEKSDAAALNELKSISAGGTTSAAASGKVSAAPAAVAVVPEYRWRFSGGIMYRRFDRISFKSGMRSSSSVIPARFPGTQSNLSVAPPCAGVVYDNGYVLPDAGTPFNGDTWFWGYTDASQIDGGNLTFQRDMGTEQFSGMDSHSSAYGWSEEDIDEPALYLEAERRIGSAGGVVFGIVVNVIYSTLSVDDSHSSFTAEQEFSRYSVTHRDSYALDGVVPPPAPYSGTYDGPGPLLHISPADSTTSHSQTDYRHATYANRICENMDVDIFTVGMGLAAAREVGRFAVSLGAGPTLNVVASDAAYDEWLNGSENGASFAVDEWHETASDTDLLLGVFGQAALDFALTDHLRIGLVGRYDWMDTIDGMVGPSTYEISLKGFSGSLLLSWTY
jgi:hypothetical protein